MPTILPPDSFAQSQGTLGFAYVFAAAKVRAALADKFDPRALGVAGLVGDLAGSGSDILRDVRVDGVGFAERFTSLAGETDVTPDSGMTLAYDTFTVGMYGLAKRETWKQQILGRPGTGVSLDDLVQKVPDSLLATWRYVLCTTGAGISGVVGTAGTDADVDGHLAVAAHFVEQLGATGRPKVLFAPQQLTQLQASYRSEPAFNSFAADFKEIQMLGDGQLYQNFAGLGMDIAITDDVVQSGGAYQGFASKPGGIGWARASTANVKPAGKVIGYVPEYGLLIFSTDMDTTKQGRFEALFLFGMALASDEVVPKIRWISQV